MTFTGYLQIFTVILIVLVLSPAYARYMSKVFRREKTSMDFLVNWLERLIYRLCGINPEQEQHWSIYLYSLVVFSVVSLVAMITLLTMQGFLPFNPEGFDGVKLLTAFNTAVSYITTTNWQVYAGESTMSYFSQSLVLTVQNFLAAAVGISVAIAFIRAFARENAKTIGNFWVDVTRTVLWVLLPLCVFITPILILEGVPQNIDSYVISNGLSGAEQKIPMGPIASQMAIKHLGTNGGGFLNANAAHPFENPSAITNLIYIISILFIGCTLTHVFGIMVGDRGQGYIILTVMIILFLVSLIGIYYFESQPNPILEKLNIEQGRFSETSGGNMEGKEVRFGIAGSALFAAATTATSAGAVNSMHDSFAPLSGMLLKLNMMLGEINIGGVGSGFYSMLVFVIITVFTAGLMVGRTPEYIGKKIEMREIKIVMLAMLVGPVGIIVFSSLVVLLPAGVASVSNPGPHGLSQILYNYSSAIANNGSAFGGFNSGTNLHVTLSAIAMLIGRFVIIVCVLALAGALAEKKKIPPSIATMPTDSAVFAVLLTVVILVVGGLTFFPSLVLGPVAEHLLLLSGKTF